MRLTFAVVILGVAVSPINAQWEMQKSNTGADLRGIYSVSKQLAWASGTNGTVLHTRDGGRSWTTCAVPRGAEHLDFRGVQSVDEKTAFVMSSGRGDLSRIYKTTDGCKTWKLLFTNPDKDGFWDAMFHDAASGTTFILGDPVDGRFALFDCGREDQCSRVLSDHPATALPGQAAFAASNSNLITNAQHGQVSFITGGSRSELVREESRSPLLFPAGESSGAFSIAQSDDNKHVVVVGGDYKSPNKREGTAAFSTDGGYNFVSAKTPPNGYRSAVAYDGRFKTWIAVGPNGTDISTDNGQNWRAFGATHDGKERDWNALSLPFVVGPHGRIGKLLSGTLSR